MKNFLSYLTGLVIGLVIGFGFLIYQSSGHVDDCKLQGYYEYQGDVIKCMVIERKQLIKHNL